MPRGLLEEGGSLQQAGACVELQRLFELAAQRLDVAFLRRHPQSHGRFALELEPFELDVDRQFGAAGQQRHGLQRMIRPAPLRGGHERALERGVTALLEEIHQRLA